MMKTAVKKMAIALLLAIVGFAQMALSQTNTPVPLFSGEFGTILMSRYYGTIFGGTFYNGPMSFTDIALKWNNGLLKGAMIIDLSAGQKLDRLNSYNADGGNEYDIALDQTMRFGGEKYPILVDIGTTYLALHNLRLLRDDAWSQTARLDFPIRADLPGGPIVQPYLQAYHYNTLGGMRDEGWIGYVGLIRDQRLNTKLFGSDLVLNVDYRLGINAGVYGSQKGVEYHRLALSLPIHWKKWTITPSVIGQTPGGDDRTYVHKSEIFGTLSVRHPL